MRLKGITAVTVALATVISSGTTASAETIARSGYWNAYYVAANRACGMGTNFRAQNGDLGALHIKWFAGSNGLMVQAFKDSWRFPQDKTPVPLTLGFDDRRMFEVEGLGYLPEQT